MTTVLATGAWLKNRAALWRDGRWRLSPEHGNLGDPAACDALAASCEALLAEAGGRVDAVAHDLHPDFFSTRHAQALAQRLGVRAFEVQHHHAHVAAVLAEHGATGPVVGLALDGVGLGIDGRAWGGEVLVVDATGWRRLGHLMPLALPGGDRAATQPWRMAAAALHAVGRADEIVPRFGPRVGATIAEGVEMMLHKGLNCPPTSAAGRWFDAAAGILGVSVSQSREAEAAMALEALAEGQPTDGEVVALPHRAGIVDHRPLMRRLLELADAGRVVEGATLFHRSLGEALVNSAALAASEAGCTQVALGGGCFANRVLLAHVEHGLAARGLGTLKPKALSCGDAGLAVGQAWGAASALAADPVRRETEAAPCV